MDGIPCPAFELDGRASAQAAREATTATWIAKSSATAEVIEWIARQSWSNGHVGGIGRSYYARMQWCHGMGGRAVKVFAFFTHWSSVRSCMYMRRLIAYVVPQGPVPTE